LNLYYIGMLEGTGRRREERGRRDEMGVVSEEVGRRWGRREGGVRSKEEEKGGMRDEGGERRGEAFREDGGMMVEGEGWREDG
jgi:hypothetical protein